MKSLRCVLFHSQNHNLDQDSARIRNFASFSILKIITLTKILYAYVIVHILMKETHFIKLNCSVCIISETSYSLIILRYV